MYSINSIKRSALLVGNIIRQTVRQSAANYNHNAYDHDGRTKVTIFNTQQDLGVMITGFSQFGFRMNNDLVVLGPVAVFPRSLLSWNVESMENISEETLSIFTALEPKIDVLILGIGDQTPTPAVSKKILGFMRKYKINVEILRTEQACATFNFLNAENRMVAAALIPPVHLTYNENDLVSSGVRKMKEGY